ncbi:MAG TPA: bifunctional DNA primase/polymerase [Roseiarcus sp.]|nr:bifunctional DNA primase/polymerase [Roseiarcus sp.]
MDGSKNINRGDGAQQSAPDCALRYARADFLIFPVNADKKPLTTHGFKDATSDPAAVTAWQAKWPHCEFAWAVPADVVVVDVDVKHGKNGYRDFERLAGCDPRDVLTPQATTPSGGLQVFFTASKPYKNAVGINGTGIDIRALGGYVVLPLPGNGREWLRGLIGGDGAMAQLLPAPAWLDCVVRKGPSTRPPLVLAPRAALAPPSSDSWAQGHAQAELERACAKIVAAPCGEQENTRHAMCFYVGSLVAHGDLGFVDAYEALLEAALAMPVHRAGDPWRNLEARVARSIEAGIGQPLALSKTEQWVRDFRARMRLKLAEARNG